MKIQKETFFAQIGSALFKNRLSDTQRQGLNTLLGYWEQHFSKQDLRWLAYVLGTVHHEVRKSMQPIHEDGADQYFFDKYDIQGHNPETAKELGNIYPGDGVKFHGRGFVQLTGRSNYAYWAKRLNLDLLNDPDNALQPEVASTILFHGMIEGRFTGKALSDYINETEEDWINARRIVNRLDKAEEIKTYAQQYW
ncbi:hypothetical protein SAMN05660964_01141 [Thiothrix caldifontis]|uniref:Chitinase class I n=1 Tax=Thiothrix caldifontis TaxID=525918 RepID=A0A1H3ZEB5_9GAMM|nr:hypothetical protein [Thiothrix caldifontis]SEA21751.1 hypothetical protein SAMN05660964_01141 [Thiothrix caldifontis]